MKKLLVVVDYQNDFVSGSLGFKDALSIEDYLADLIEKYHQNNDDVIFTLDTHQTDYLNSQEGKNLPITHCIENSEGWMLYGKIKDLAKNDYQIKKETNQLKNRKQKCEKTKKFLWFATNIRKPFHLHRDLPLLHRRRFVQRPFICLPIKSILVLQRHNEINILFAHGACISAHVPLLQAVNVEDMVAGEVVDVFILAHFAHADWTR